MSRLVADPNRLGELVDRLTAVAAELTEVRAQADARVRDLGVAWVGDAAQRQAAAHARWDAGAAEAHEALVALRAAVAVAQRNYLAAATANRRMWSV